MTPKIDPSLIELRDRWARVIYLKRADLDNQSKRLLKIYTRAGKYYGDLLKCDERRDNSLILRSNICPHDPQTFKTFRIFADDVPGQHCPVCAPQLTEYDLP